MTRRRTYVLSVREEHGPALVEEVRTGRKAQLPTIGEAFEQVEQWLREPEQPFGAHGMIGAEWPAPSSLAPPSPDG